MTENDFEQRRQAIIKDLQAMAKRANTRLRYQEKTGRTEVAYKKAKEFTKGGYFYQGKNYDSLDDMQRAKIALTDYLGTPTSTSKGYKREIEKPQQLRSMNEEQLKTYAQKLARKANRQLNELERANKTQYAYKNAEVYNVKQQDRKKNRFYTGRNFANKKDIKRHIDELEKFLSMETSNVKGYEKTINKRIETFRRKGVNIEKGNEKAFFDFLNSKEFEQLSKFGDSNNIVEFYANTNVAPEVEEINEKFNEYKNTLMTPKDFMNAYGGKWIKE